SSLGFPGTHEQPLIRHEHDGPRLSSDPAISARSFVELDLRWRHEIIRRYGRRAYAGFFRRTVRDHTIRAMNLAPLSEQRVAAAGAARQLARRLPWSATSIGHPLLLLTIGPERYRRLRSGYRRALLWSRRPNAGLRSERVRAER